MNVPSGDAVLYCEEQGSGPPLVLLHPFPSNHKFWGPVLPELAQRYRVLTPDLRGSGGSSAGQGPATMAKHAADIERVCVASGVRKAAFIGVSIGGYILFEFWRRHADRVAALVLSDTRATPDTPEGRAARLKSIPEVEQHGPAAFVQNMSLKLLGETTRRNRPDVTRSALDILNESTVAGIAALQQGMAERPDSVPTLAAINVPTLVVVGEEDTLTPPSDAQQLHEGIAGSRLVRIPQAGHFAPFEQPEAFAKAVRAFLDSQPRWE
ncbi:MAG TPA: alpha/beta fold hydrolase [Terriglobales bacterium]|nr:alpha/beta fold hydrolase [Terriglobales bacterium]